MNVIVPCLHRRRPTVHYNVYCENSWVLRALRKAGAEQNAYRPFKVIQGQWFWRTNRKGVCDFLLVINSNFGPILHRFWDTASYWLKIANFSYSTPPLLDAPVQGEPVSISEWNLPVSDVWGNLRIWFQILGPQVALVVEERSWQRPDSAVLNIRIFDKNISKIYLLYMRMSGVQISLDGSRILCTPPYWLSFHDNL